MSSVQAEMCCIFNLENMVQYSGLLSVNITQNMLGEMLKVSFLPLLLLELTEDVSALFFVNERQQHGNRRDVMKTIFSSSQYTVAGFRVSMEKSWHHFQPIPGQQICQEPRVCSPL